MLANLIIRPPRNTYPDDSLENNSLHYFSGKKYIKRVLKLSNSANNSLLCCSMIESGDEDYLNYKLKMPCLIYMHGNAGNKREGESLAYQILPLGINLFCFDFSGCGNS